MVHRNYYAGKEWKHISLPKPEISLKKLNDNSLQVATDKPAFFVTLSSDGLVFDNNSFILLPGEKEIINVQFLKEVKLKIKNITIHTLNKYLD
jgi:hypothetical protein